MLFSRHFFSAALLAAALAAGLDPSPSQGEEAAAPQLLPLCPEANSAPLSTLGKRAPVTDDQPIDVTSEHGSINIGGDAKVTGKAVVHQGDRMISADEVSLNTVNKGVDVSGNVEYVDPEIRVHGLSGHYEAGDAQFLGADFQMLQQPSRGQAARLALDKDGILRLEQVNYTTCPPGHADWQINAAAVELDTQHQTGVAHDASIEFKGVPLLYLPWISFPLSSTRTSGFLFPSIGSSSRGGLQFSAPFYLNLAPNYDLQLDPTMYSRRGADVNGELRFLTETTTGSFIADYLPNDQVTHTDRSRLKLLSTTELPDDWRLKIGAENVSDTLYFEDFAQGANATSIAFLPRELELSYRDLNWSSGAILRNFQTLDAGLAEIDRPYTELPRLYSNGLWKLSGGLPLEYGFDSEAVDFRRNVGVQGWRLDLTPKAQLNFDGAGYFLHPSLAFRSTTYELTDTVAGQSSSPSRNLPEASLDTGLLFERELGAHDQQRITLEPRLMYLYVPYRRQDTLPVFDTGLPDLNWVELFRTNRYVGADRVGDANQLSTGVTTRLFDGLSGMRYLSATLGQTFYFTPPRVLLPDEIPGSTHSSDTIAQVELKAFQHWSMDMGLQWNHHDDQAEKSEIQIQYQPENRSVVNVGYRYQRDLLEQADVSAAWPVAQGWNLYGRMLYSLRDRSAIDQFAGFEYSSCCWGLRLVARHYVSTRTGQRDTGIFLQLELKGLSNVGTAADAFLEQSIRGYSPTTQKH
jgi:LPS-assembly protein